MAASERLFSVEVTGPVRENFPSYRRAGRAWPPGKTQAEVTAAQYHQLKADRMTPVRLLEDGPEPELPTPATPAAAPQAPSDQALQRAEDERFRRMLSAQVQELGNQVLHLTARLDDREDEIKAAGRAVNNISDRVGEIGRGLEALKALGPAVTALQEQLAAVRSDLAKVNAPPPPGPAAPTQPVTAPEKTEQVKKK